VSATVVLKDTILKPRPATRFSALKNPGFEIVL
jgi:hypothetical protein